MCTRAGLNPVMPASGMGRKRAALQRRRGNGEEPRKDGVLTVGPDAGEWDHQEHTASAGCPSSDISVEQGGANLDQECEGSEQGVGPTGQQEAVTPKGCGGLRDLNTEEPQ